MSKTKSVHSPEDHKSTDHKKVMTMFKFLGSAMGIIFIIGLVVVIGFFMLIF